MGNETMTGRLALIALAIEHDGDWQAVYDDIKGRKSPSDESLRAARAAEGRVVTILDEGYPEVLKSIGRPPFVLTRTGSAEIGGKTAYVVCKPGHSPHAERYAETAKRTIVADLRDSGWNIMESDQNGITVTSPSGEKATWSVLPPGSGKTGGPTEALEHTRIAASWAERTVVVAADNPRGKGRMAAAFAINAGRDVFATPHPIDDGDKVCNGLIAIGASVAGTKGWAE